LQSLPTASTGGNRLQIACKPPVPRCAIVSTITTLRSRPVHDSLDELLAGCTSRQPFAPADARSGSRFEWVVVDGERLVLKHVHLDDDFTMRASGDLGCRPLRVWQSGLMDLAPQAIDHAVLGVARGDGRNAWGAALLLRDVSTELVPIGDEPIGEEQHLAFLDHLAALAAAGWGWRDGSGDATALGLLRPEFRWSWFAPASLDGERALGWPERVPQLAAEGWERFAGRARRDVVALVAALHADPAPLVDALRATPWTFLHGDWKLGNLGTASDGRTVLLDWAYPGEGPVAHELAWYLALNRARLPLGHSKESTIVELRAALERHGVDTAGWWDRQLDLCLLGALVQFGWEKAFGPDEELSWWCERAAEGGRRL
jgi:hypothetical protein